AVGAAIFLALERSFAHTSLPGIEERGGLQPGFFECRQAACACLRGAAALERRGSGAGQGLARVTRPETAGAAPPRIAGLGPKLGTPALCGIGSGIEAAL